MSQQRSAPEDLDELRREIASLREAVVALEDNRASATKRLDTLEERARAAEEESSNLANLYITAYRLHGTLDRAEVVSTVMEVVINMVGSEELAIYELAPDGETLVMLGCFGIDERRYQTLSASEGRIGRTVARGALYIAEPGDQPLVELEQHLSVCVPLRRGDRVTGVIAIFRLLSQKEKIGSADKDLFDLLSTHAANALYCSALHEAAAAPSAAPPLRVR